MRRRISTLNRSQVDGGKTAKRRQLRVATAEQRYTRERFFQKASDRLDSDLVFFSRVKEKAEAILAALDNGAYHSALWPRSLVESLAVVMILNELIEQGARQYLLEMSEAKLRLLDRVCVELGISYDDLTAKAFVECCKRGGLPSSEPEENDSVDWWKKA